MQKLTFDVAGHKYDVEAASCWNEVSQDEFITFVKYLGNQGEGIDISTLLVMAKIPEVAAINLTTAQWWWLHDHFKWMLDMEKVDSLMIDTLTLADGTVLHGYNGDFSDVTFEEWMFADTYANANRWDVVTAVLYRPEKENWDGESDRRIPFTKYGADKRSPLIAELDSDIIKAVRLNYLLLRRRLTLKYKRLFYDADEIENDESKQKKRSGANWLSLVRNVMGDNFYEEEKYLRISVPAMFFQLDRMIKESNERKRHVETNKQIQLVATGYCTSIDEYLQSQAYDLDKPGFIIDRDGSVYGIRTETPKVALVNVGPVILRDGLWLPAEEGADGKYHPIEGADPVRVPYEYCSCRKYHGCQHYEMFPDKQLRALRRLLGDIKQELGMSYPWDNQMGAVCPRAVNGGSGIYFASSYDEQRSDPHPQKELLDIIKRLADDNH